MLPRVSPKPSTGPFAGSTGGGQSMQQQRQQQQQQQRQQQQQAQAARSASYAGVTRLCVPRGKPLYFCCTLSREHDAAGLLQRVTSKVASMQRRLEP
eukprot:210813-Pelagomonas_calceolata.AAC.5